MPHAPLMSCPISCLTVVNKPNRRVKISNIFCTASGFGGTCPAGVSVGLRGIKLTMTSFPRKSSPSCSAHVSSSLTPPRTQYSIIVFIFGPEARYSSRTTMRSSNLYALAVGTIFCLNSCVGACKLSAKHVPGASRVSVRILGMTPTVLTVILLALNPNPLSSRITSIASITLA